jgi:hypothetical protein
LPNSSTSLQSIQIWKSFGVTSHASVVAHNAINSAHQ